MIRYLGWSFVALVATATALAQANAFLTVTVVDDDGEPIPEVAVTVTAEHDTEYEKKLTTNAKGRFDLTVFDGTKDYDALLEKEGYGAVRTVLRPEVGERTRLTVVMSPPTAGSAAATPSAGPPAGGEAGRLFDEGVAATRAGDLETARARFEAAVEADPELAAGHSALAGLHYNAGDWEAAVAAAERALELTPGDYRCLRIRYEALQQLGDAEAIAAAREALREVEDESDMAALLYNEGAAATKIADYATAEERFREALELDPGLTAAHSALAITLFQQGRHDDAAAEARVWLTAEPGNVNALRVLYESLRAQGRDEEAREVLAEITAASAGGDPEAMVEQARASFESGDVAAARAVLERVVAGEPEHALAHYLLGLCLLSQGESEQARANLERFLELAPQHPEAASAREMLGYLE